MASTVFSSEGALLFIMVATVALGFWLQRFKVFKTLGPALTVIVMGIVMSNLRIVPTSSPTYDAISSYCVPLSVSICLLSLDLKQMRKLSKEPIIALASAIFSVCVAALVFGILFANKIDEGWKVAGMFVGTYTGGSSNLTAIAVGLDASKNTIASANAADYVVGIPTLILMFATPALYKSSKWLKKLWPYDMSESELLGDGSQYGLHLQYKVQPSPDGLAQAFILGEEFINGEPCAMVLGDNIFYGNGFSRILKAAVKNVEQEKRATVFGYYVNDPERFGIIEFDETGKAISVEEKP